MPSTAACDDAVKVREQARVDVEIGDEHGPQHDQDAKRREELQRRG